MTIYHEQTQTRELYQKRQAGQQIAYRDLGELTGAFVIDYACTGNSGRSPLAEAIATDTICEKGLEGKIVAISSGTNRAVMEGKEPPINLQYMALERAVERNKELQLYTETECKEIKTYLADREKTTKAYMEKGKTYAQIRKYEEKARREFTKEEHAFREKARKELQIKTPIKKGGQQTEQHHSIRQFYGLALSNEEAARKIYQGAEEQPEFGNLDIENAFGLPYEDYIAMVQELKIKVERTIEDAAEKVEHTIEDVVQEAKETKDTTAEEASA